MSCIRTQLHKETITIHGNKCYDRWRVFARGVINPSKMTPGTGLVSGNS